LKYLFGDKSEEQLDVITPLPEYTEELEELEDLFEVCPISVNLIATLKPIVILGPHL